MTTVASKVPFYQLCVLLDKINERRGTEAKKEVLRDFLDHWRNCHRDVHKDTNTTDSFYPALRLLLPQLEKEREAYGIREHTLAKLYIQILGLGKDSPSAQKLLNFRSPKNAKGDVGDFASVAYWVLKPRCPEKGTLTVKEVNDCLDSVARNNAAKNKDDVMKSLMHMLKNMSAREQKWLIRIIMKELKMGLSQQSIFSIFHQDAEDLYNVKMSLEKVCTMLRDPTVRLHEIEISLFAPFRPMLGDRGVPSKIEKLLDNKPFYLETKFDGERMQLHKKGDEYKFYSRSGNEYTHIYGGNAFDGNLVPYIDNCFKDHINSCILDGEMVGYDSATKTVGSKGENFDIKSDKLERYQPMLCVFDILLINDQVLSNKSLKERRDILKNVFNHVDGRLVISEYKEGRTKQDCTDALNDAIERREEGIMVKDPDSNYTPNKRKGGWYKLKPEYVGGLMDELDCLVVGGYYGGGTRAGMMSHFLCAVAQPPESGDKPTEFHSFCRVGSGYSKRELFEFNCKLVDHWKPFEKKRPPQWLCLASGLRQRPDAYIEPSKSLILQIKAAEIIDSEQFKTGCTLRFPRVEKIRYDKNWFDCMTITEIEDLKEKSAGKLAGRYADADDDEPLKKKRRGGTTRHIKPTVMGQFRTADFSDVKQVSEMLAGKEICVINGPPAHPKASIEKKIFEYGGTVVQNPGEDTFCVLANKIAIRVRNMISKGIYDVVRVDWLLHCIESGKLLPWVPGDMLHTSPKTTELFAQDYDCYGDSYFEDTTPTELRKVFNKIEKEELQAINSEEMAEIEEEYFPHDSPNGLFRLCRVYLDSNLVIGESDTHIKNSSLELLGLELRFFGASLTDRLDKQVSHVVVNSKDLKRVQSLREINRERKKKFYIVTEEWVSECISSGKLLQERNYEPSNSL